MNDSAKQQTKVGEIRGIIEDIHSRSLDIKAKACELANSPIPSKNPEAEIEPATDTVGNELSASLRKIRGILREAHDTLSEFN